jgi:hypothetical protein
MTRIDQYIHGFQDSFVQEAPLPPWEISEKLGDIIFRKLSALGDEFTIKDHVAIHKTAIKKELFKQLNKLFVLSYFYKFQSTIRIKLNYFHDSSSVI